MHYLTYQKASIFHGNNTRGYNLIERSQNMHMSSLFDEIMPTYQKVYSWPIYQSKAQALDILKLIAIMAYVNTLDFHWTVYNTSIISYAERDHAELILWDDINDVALLELYDESIAELIEDGFLNPRNKLQLHESMLQYFNQV